MKILFVAEHLAGTDGWSRYSHDVIFAVKEQGHDVSCFVHSISPIPIRQMAVLDRPEKYLAGIFCSAKLAFKIVVEIVRNRPDVVHFLVEPYASALFFMPRLGVRYVETVHGTYAFIPRLFKKYSWLRAVANILWRGMFRKIDAIVAVSLYTRNYLIESVGLSLKERVVERCSVISNGVNIQNLITENRDRHIGRGKPKQILFVGAVKKRKGIIEGIEALGLYKKKYRADFIWNIAGSVDRDGLFYKILEQKIVECGLESNIRFLGRIDEKEKRRLFLQSDLYLMLPIMDSGAFEGFGLVYLEANMFGVPVVGSLKSGAEEAIKEGVSGFLVDPYNPLKGMERIADVLDRGIIDPGLCRKWAEEHDISRIADRLISLYAYKQK